MRFSILLGATASALSLIASGQAFAQAAAEDKDSGTLEEIVVTAQKRSENLQKVPIAVAAVDPGRLAETGVQNTQGLAAALPGLQLLNIAGNVTPRVRGVGSGVTAAGFESPVATYVDGVYLAFGADVNMDLFDVSQVSLIKGPQGTLFGRNATGGVLQITTRDPEHEFGGRMRASLDNFLTMKGDAFLTGGLSDTVAASLSTSFTHQGRGWGKNIFTGNDTHKIDHDFSIRGKIKAEIGDATTVRLAADYSNRRGSTSTEFTIIKGTQAIFPVTVQKKGWDTDSYVDPVNKYRGGGGSISIDHDFGGAKLTSITAYRSSTSSFYFTAVPTPTPSLDILVPEKSQEFTQELQLASTGDGPLNWTVGAFYFYNKASQDQHTFYRPGFVNAIGGPGVFPFVEDHVPVTQTVKSPAIYGQATYSVTDHTRLTAGIRYTWQRATFAGNKTFFFPDGSSLVVAQAAPGEHSTFKKPTWRLSIDQDLAQDVTGYISYNRGVKSGGYNLRNPEQLFYLPERLDAYEAGIKSLLADRRVRLNVSGFYYKYANIQVPVFQATLVITNGGAAEIYGADVDLEARISDNLTLNASANWLHAKFTKFDGAVFALDPGNVGYPTVNTLQSAAGNDVPYSPHLTYTIGATYKIPTSSGNVALNVNDNYNSGFYGDSQNFLRQKSYHFINASVAWTDDNSGITARVFANNILNKDVLSQFEPIVPFCYQGDYTNPPRVIGGSIELKF